MEAVVVQSMNRPRRRGSRRYRLAHASLDIRYDHGDRVVRAGIVRRSGISELPAGSRDVWIAVHRCDRLRDRGAQLAVRVLPMQEEDIRHVCPAAVIIDGPQIA